jgi:flagellar motor component MotA
MSIYEFHYVGGMPFMVPLAIILLGIIGLIALTLVRGEGTGSIRIETIKHLGGFALAWGIFGTIVGLYQAFSDLSQMEEMIPLQHIMGGLKVALITALYGFGIFLFTQLAVIGLRLRNSSK